MIAGIQGAYTTRSDGPGGTITGIYTIAAYDAAAGMRAFLFQ